MLEGQNFEVREDACLSPLVSIVVAVLNEEEAVGPFVQAINDAVLSGWIAKDGVRPPSFEIIFVDDGSIDETSARIRELRGADPRIKLISLSRNFGKEAALCAGLKAAAGDAVVPMDVDLQDPPDLLRPMVDRWRSGAQIVNAKRIDRSSDTFIKRVSSRTFYSLINLISDHPIAPDVGDFRLLDRAAVNALNQLEEHSRFNKGLFSWIGFRSETLEYVRPQRSTGDTKWSFSNLIGLGIDGVISSTTLPLRVWTIIGAFVASLALLYAAVLVVHTLATGVDTPGYASLMVAVLFLGGLNLFSLGLFGEYIGRIVMQVRGRPLYIVAETEGF